MKKLNTLEELIHYRRSQGAYFFTLAEVQDLLGLSFNAAKQSIFRHRKNGSIAQVRQGFYIIIPPEYSIAGMLPLNLYVDDMMKWLNRPYYLALFTAAAMHGASHQQPMESFIITEKPALRKISNSRNVLNFIVKQTWDTKDVIQMKTDGGYVNVSSPELTALDLLNYLDKSGINRVSTVITELADSMKAEKLRLTAGRYPKTSAVQRLGYILEYIAEKPDLADGLQRIILTKKIHYTALSPHYERKGEFIPKWEIIKNMEVETDI